MPSLYGRIPELIRAMYYDGTNGQEIYDSGLVNKDKTIVENNILYFIDEEMDEIEQYTKNYYVTFNIDTKKTSWISPKRFKESYKEITHG